MKIKKEMKKFRMEGVTVVFWKECGTLFCKVSEMGADLYCCGDRQMPKTKEEALKLTEVAWLW